MTGPPRKLGRPGRMNGGNGAKARLIAAACQHLQRKAPVDLPRKQLAMAAGVAPGLVAYYFPTDLDLVQAAARPVIDGYLVRLAALLATPSDLAATLRSLVLLLLEIARDNGNLLDTYIALAKQHQVDVSKTFLADAYGHLTGFMTACEAAGILEIRNSAFAQTVLWGICKTVAQQQELAVLLADADGEDGVAARQAELILDIVVPRRRASAASRPRLRASATSPRLPATD